MVSKRLHQPWQSMLLALDQQLTQDTELHCMGGFVLAEYCGLVRPTADVDVLESTGTDKATIAILAGRGSPLHKRHGVYIDIVTVADVPDDYDARLIAMDIEGLTRLRLKVLERHDLVLAKLSRNIDRDREDVVALAHGPGLDVTSCGSGTRRNCGRSWDGRSERTSPYAYGSRCSRSLAVAHDSETAGP